ncbi:probable disease resistance protein RPP1 [Eutrema salsugineum]|uniref:probable disease resistance protein RPP1 n=1 Tax=Eutrema salsugineum TaxID=72664 RepID=UPI000CECFF1C|nr:probable disease resistance protein RPP1 [Eutrema salsugineum]
MFLTGILKWILGEFLYKWIRGESRTDKNSIHEVTTASTSSSSLSSSLTNQYSYDVFPSFSGHDVRRTFLSHFLEGLKSKDIKTFKDNGIKRSESINSELIRAIRESRIAVVILSKNYASSSWCLNELQMIMECRVSLGQTVMTIFYELEPSDVRKQTGDFGKAFKETCVGKTEKEKQRWREALTQVAVIAGEHSFSWPSEVDMISKIIMDISNELPSSDFHRLVGIETHVENMKSLMCLESDEVKIVVIWGPAGIGKTTIARALYEQVSCYFQLKLYKETLYPELNFENELYAGVLDHRGMKIPDLQEAKFRFKYQRVLLILDDVYPWDLKALGNLIQGLSFGSKVIVTVQNLDTLKDIMINQIYKVSYPSSEEAQQIFSYSAFGQSSPPRGYLEHAVELAKLIAPIPLCLKALGSALRGKNKEEWTMASAKLKTYRDNNDVEKAIRYVYESLSQKHTTLLYMLMDQYRAENLNDVILSLVEMDWDVEKGIQTLADLALISISRERGFIVHSLVANIHYKNLMYKSLPHQHFVKDMYYDGPATRLGATRSKKRFMRFNFNCQGCQVLECDVLFLEPRQSLVPSKRVGSSSQGPRPAKRSNTQV